MAVAKSSSQLSSAEDSGERNRSAAMMEVGGGKDSLPGVARGCGKSWRVGAGLLWSNLGGFRNDPASGDLKASFHSWTLLTASSYSVDFFGTTESDLRALTIQGCLSSLRADTRRFGSFWKHCIRKSFTAYVGIRHINSRGHGEPLPGKRLAEAEDGRR